MPTALDERHLDGIERAFAPNRADLWPPSDRLVGIGFRCWVSGYQTSDIACWEVAWAEYANTFGTSKAKAAVTELAYWVRIVKLSAARTLEVYPAFCRRFCRDERLAISTIAACQHGKPLTARGSATALLGHNRVEPMLEAAEDFAALLEEFGAFLTTPWSPGASALAAQKDAAGVEIAPPNPCR